MNFYVSAEPYAIQKINLRMKTFVILLETYYKKLPIILNKIPSILFKENSSLLKKQESLEFLIWKLKKAQIIYTF